MNPKRGTYTKCKVQKMRNSYLEGNNSERFGEGDAEAEQKQQHRKKQVQPLASR